MPELYLTWRQLRQPQSCLLVCQTWRQQDLFLCGRESAKPFFSGFFTMGRSRFTNCLSRHFSRASRNLRLCCGYFLHCVDKTRSLVISVLSTTQDGSKYQVVLLPPLIPRKTVYKSTPGVCHQHVACRRRDCVRMVKCSSQVAQQCWIQLWRALNVAVQHTIHILRAYQRVWPSMQQVQV